MAAIGLVGPKETIERSHVFCSVFESQELQLAHVSGKSPTWMRPVIKGDDKLGHFASANDLLLVGRSSGPDSCVMDLTRSLTPSGWVTTSSLNRVLVPGSPSAMSWIGKWAVKVGTGATTAKIKIVRNRGGLTASAESVWQNPFGDARQGGFGGKLAIHGNQADLTDDTISSCKVHMVMLGRQLVVLAASDCSGEHAELTGIYRKRS